MKAKIFTSLFIILLMANFMVNAQLNTTTGIPWGELGASEPILLNENFQGFDFFYNAPHTDDGNSHNEYAADGVSIGVYGYKNDTVEVPIIGSGSGKIKYYFKQCAFAPEWKTAYAYKNVTENTPNVSDGYVEISREYPADNRGFAPTVHGWFIVDLREIDFVEVIQWTHSSTGGNKRGVLCEFSVDNGTTWDTLRYQPGGAAFGGSFTKDVTTGDKTLNGYRCDPSAFGMTWEDGIWSDQPIMLRFGECGGQTARIHDLKVFGTWTPPTSAFTIDQNQLNIYKVNRTIRISEQAKVAVYNIDGRRIKEANRTNSIQMNDVPDGIYLVKAQAGERVKTAKIFIK